MITHAHTHTHTHTHTHKTYTGIFAAALWIIIKTWRELKCSSKGEWIKCTSTWWKILKYCGTWRREWISKILHWGKEVTLERLQAVWGHVYDLWKKSKLQGLRIEGWLPEAWVKSLTTKREHSGIFGILEHSDCDWQSHEPTTIYTYSKKKKSNKYISWLWQKLQGSIHMSKLT